MLAAIDETMPVTLFIDLLSEKTGVPRDSMELLCGFPPRVIKFSNQQGATLASIGIRSGENITVRKGNVVESVYAPDMSEDEQLARAIAASLEEDSSRKGEEMRHREGSGDISVVRRVVADDNSCLFSAVGYVAKGSRGAASMLRNTVADAVLQTVHDSQSWTEPAEPWTSEAVLGKTPEEYSAWIRDPRRWGGGIELNILSARLGLEIAAFDIQTLRVDIYGQGKGYTQRVMLVYDGLHYDALAVAGSTSAYRELPAESEDTTVIPSNGEWTDRVMEAAASLVATLHSSKQFTDTSNFTLRCGTCKIGLKGEKEAVAHARATGHTNFSEY
jgi:ubiquitin thioesterase OTU1